LKVAAKLRGLVSGIATYVPGAGSFRAKGTGGAASARYCYSVWLRQLVMAEKNGLDTCPGVVAELGPGDSLGIGFAALISGSDRYIAFDVVKHATDAGHIAIFDELVALFADSADIPGNDEFPKVNPSLDSYDFPADVLDEDRLLRALEPSRIQGIRDSICRPECEDSPVRYVVPWYDASVLEANSVDMIFSQAVLEHVDDLANTYRAMRMWLKPTGYVSHEIDFTSHGHSDEWNGHWGFSDGAWRVIRGRRPYLLNREPHSTHIALLEEERFVVVCDRTTRLESNLRRDDLAPKFRLMSEEDLTTSCAFIQATRTE
jgi:hypothetical protein